MITDISLRFIVYVYLIMISFMISWYPLSIIYRSELFVVYQVRWGIICTFRNGIPYSKQNIEDFFIPVVLTAL